jgi:hypothetical protein
VQLDDVIAAHPDVERELHARLIEFLREHDMPPGQLELYERPEPGPGGPLLPPGTELHVATGPDGRTYAFVDEHEARLCFAELRSIALGELEPSALVALGDQYYRAEDLTRSSCRERRY